jgi:hypothetical protein
VSICADVQLALAGMIKLIKEVNKHRSWSFVQ